LSIIQTLLNWSDPAIVDDSFGHNVYLSLPVNTATVVDYFAILKYAGSDGNASTSNNAVSAIALSSAG
jgi:hypothetical protein